MIIKIIDFILGLIKKIRVDMIGFTRYCFGGIYKIDYDNIEIDLKLILTLALKSD